MKRLVKWLLDLWTRFMEGRYGLDGLSGLYLCISSALVACVMNMEPGKVRILTGIGAALLAGYGLYRCFSKDRQKHQQQWDDFESGFEELDYKMSLRIGVWKIRHSYRYIRCKSCGHRFRVSRNREKHTVSCPNCKKKISRRT